MSSRLAVHALRSTARAAANEPVEKIGFLGLGQMGFRMVANLLTSAGQELVVCDESAQAMHVAADLGAETVSTPAALASTEGVRVIVSMLPSTSNVRDAYLGRDGIVHAAAGVRPSLLIDCSTIDPQSSREIAAEVQRASLHHDALPFSGCSAAHPAMIDAPVSGGVTGASAATLTFMVGGSRDAARAAEPYLKMMGKHVLHCGRQGNGQAAKVSNNLALAIQMASVAEAMAFGISQGLDKNVLANIFNISSSRCWSSSDYNPVPGVQEGVPASRDYKGGFSCAHMLKDLNLAASSSGGLPMPMGQRVLEMYEKVAEEHPHDDFGSIFRHIYREGKDQERRGAGGVSCGV